MTGHFSNTDLRDVVDICCRYELQLSQNKKIKTRTLLLTIKLTFKKIMLLLSNFDRILMTIATKKIRKSGNQMLVQNYFFHEI